MSENSFNIDDILNSVKSLNMGVSRYRTINGIRYSHEELEKMDLQLKEELLNPSNIDYTSLDEDLKLLNIEYEKEINPIKRKILILKYDIMVESFGPITRDSLESIEEYQKELAILQSQLKDHLYLNK